MHNTGNILESFERRLFRLRIGDFSFERPGDAQRFLDPFREPIRREENVRALFINRIAGGIDSPAKEFFSDQGACLEVLLEVHSREEIEGYVGDYADVIGVNNRNLHTFEVTLQTSLALANEVPPGVVLISESGLKDADDLLMLQDVGYRGFLIGETLMRADGPAEMLRSLIRSQVSTK